MSHVIIHSSFGEKKNTWKGGEKERKREQSVLRINPDDSRFNPRSNLLNRQTMDVHMIMLSRKK